jgi:hypothetical protein
MMDRALLDQARRVAAMTGNQLTVRIPSVLATGEEFTARLSATGPDALPLEEFRNPLVFDGSTGIEGLPSSFQFARGECTGSITGLRAVGPEVALLRLRVKETDHRTGDPVVTSNPAWVLDNPPYRVFWGDIHVHTLYSNCGAWRCLAPEWCYEYARDISFLDFAAAADHLRGIVSDASRWPTLQRLAASYNKPGRFVTFLAFESSHAQGYGGDNNVYYLGDDAPYFWVDREDMHGTSPKVHLRELWKQLDGNGKPYMTIPHHTGRARKYRAWDEDYYDPAREPLFEIYSSWGSSEVRWSRFPISGGNNDAKTYFVDALKAGARFGVIASSDDHATLPGSVHHFRVEPFTYAAMRGFAQKGLAAVRVPSLTREALFDAMMHRRTYATTHSRSLLDVALGDAAMGEVIVADGPLRKKRTVHVAYTPESARFANVVLMRNGEPLAAKPLPGSDLAGAVNRITFEDPDDLEGIALHDRPFHPEPFVVYYVRIEDDQGAHQWSSPIWVDLT